MSLTSEEILSHIETLRVLTIDWGTLISECRPVLAPLSGLFVVLRDAVARSSPGGRRITRGERCAIAGAARGLGKAALAWGAQNTSHERTQEILTLVDRTMDEAWILMRDVRD